MVIPRWLAKENHFSFYGTRRQKKVVKRDGPGNYTNIVITVNKINYYEYHKHINKRKVKTNYYSHIWRMQFIYIYDYMTTEDHTCVHKKKLFLLL